MIGNKVLLFIFLLGNACSFSFRCHHPRYLASSSSLLALEMSVEIYSTIGCKFCRMAKTRFDEIGVEYTNYDIREPVPSDSSPRTKERIQYALSHTVPQIYVEDIHIGGATDLLEKVGTGDFFEILQKHGLQVKGPSTTTEEEKKTVETDPQTVFAFREKFGNKEALNMAIFSPGEQSSSSFTGCLALSEEMQKQALIMTDNFVTADGKLVDYGRLIQSADFQKYVMLSTQLQVCAMSDLQQMDDREKFSFFANLYNAMIIHALCVLGAPADTPAARGDFFSGRSGAKYIIAGTSWSPDDLEHGILRSNYPHPSQLANNPTATRYSMNYFPSSDVRSRLAVSQANFDPRVHFVLNCGAKSCPPIKIIDPGNLEPALKGAAGAYLTSEVQVDLQANTVKLPKLLLWYGLDFGDEMPERLKNVIKMLPVDADIRSKLQSLVSSGDAYTVEYGEYDWATNSK